MGTAARSTTSLPVAPSPRAVFLRLPLHQWMQVAAERRRLARLDDEQLRDIGVAPAEARRESERPFWDMRPR